MGFRLWCGLVWLLLLTACGLGGGERVPSVAFLARDGAGVVQLWRLDMAGGEARALTAGGEDIFDFAVGPAGEWVVYSLLEGAGGSSVWRVGSNGRSTPQQLLACPDALCTDLVWSPNGRLLLYERRDGAGAAPYLWWLDVETGETVPLLADNYAPSQAARFDATGAWVSYVAPAEGGVRLFAWENGRSLLIDNQVGSPAVWSPQGETVLLRDLNLAVLHGDEGAAHDEHGHDFNEAVQLYRVAVATGERVPLTAALSVDDGNAAWSPDGEWVAFGRRLNRTAVGRQLWLVRADGSGARALTDTPLLHHGPPSWSPNGRLLLFQRGEVGGGGGETAVVTLDIASGEMQQWATGFQPAWLVAWGSE